VRVDGVWRLCEHNGCGSVSVLVWRRCRVRCDAVLPGY
jgi:hypothetical protein